MRQAALALDSSGEFGTGLRARLEVVRAERRESEYLGAVLELRRESPKGEVIVLCAVQRQGKHRYVVSKVAA